MNLPDTVAPPSSSSRDEANYALAPDPAAPDSASGPAPAPTTREAEALERTVEVAATPGVPEAASPPVGPPPSGGGSAGPPGPPEGPKGPKLRGRKRKARKRWDLPAWAVSALVHVSVLGALGAITFQNEVGKAVANLNTALVGTKDASEELVHVYADPSTAEREMAVGDPTAMASSGPAGGEASGTGVGLASGTPSATPRVGVGRAVGERTSLPTIKVGSQLSGLAMLPSAPARSLGGGGLIAGDVTFESKDVGVALDQIAREILRHLADHKLTVVWLFDESESMKQSQRAIRDKFERISSELKSSVDPSKKAAGALTYAVVGFGKELHFEVEKPTPDVDLVARAIDRLRIDTTGVENTMQAVHEVVNRYSRGLGKDRRMLLILVTDESGNDGEFVEEARQAAVSHRVPIYIIGRQAVFGYPKAHLEYVDPVTKDKYWPEIDRGPETADTECLQIDGLYRRWEEQPSGFAPYELARLVKETGGIYFLLPSEENMRVHLREKAYSMARLKEYVPDNASRAVYAEQRARSELRRSLAEIVGLTRDFVFRREYPIDPAAMLPLIEQEYPKVTAQLNVLIAIEKRLRGLAKARDREPEKRWQAHYDLMLAQIVTYQIKAYEYRACLEAMAANPPKLKTPIAPDQAVVWVIDHSTERQAPKERTEKVYVEARRLLEQVIARHPKTPWADLAQDELNRGFGVRRNEWRHSISYGERAKYVPKY